MYSATMEFVTECVNYHGAHEAKGLLDAVDKFDAAVATLKETLTEEQTALFLGCETMLSDVDGEQCRFYFEAGFADALQFLFGWREGW